MFKVFCSPNLELALRLHANHIAKFRISLGREYQNVWPLEGEKIGAMTAINLTSLLLVLLINRLCFFP